MAYPILESVTSLEDNVSATTRAVTLPSSLQSGDRIIIVIHTTDAGGPTTINLTNNYGTFTTHSSGSLSGTSNRYGIFSKISDGTESGGVITASLANSGTITGSVYSCFRISGVESSKLTVGSVTGNSVNSPSITASWGGGENLFFSIVSHFQGGAPTVSAYPSGYSNGANYRLTNGLIARATKQSTSATDDAGAYTLSYTNARTFSLAIVVGAGSPPAITSINSGNPVKVGQTGIPIALSNYISTPNNVLCTYQSGTKSLTVSNIQGNNTAITVDLEDRSEGVDYPLIGEPLLFTVTDGVGTDTENSTIALKTGEVKITVNQVGIEYPNTYLSYFWTQAGFTVQGAEFVYLPYGDLVVDADTRISVTNAGVFTGWLRPTTGLGAGNVYYYQFTINEVGQIIGVARFFGSTMAGKIISGSTFKGKTL